MDHFIALLACIKTSFYWGGDYYDYISNYSHLSELNYDLKS